MGSSLYLQGGAATQNSVKETFTQATHGFVVGNAIRFDATQGSSGAFVLAKADTAVNAEVIGVVGSVQDNDNFTVVYHGAISIPALAGISHPALFLSDSVAGGITHNPPSAIGSIIKPVILRSQSGTRYNVVNYLGTQIGGSSTVSIDQIQPVGTIMPFAGTIIPDTWLECNGQPVGVTVYPELYDRVLFQTAPRAPMYGVVVRLTGTGVNSTNFTVGDIIQKKGNATTTWVAGIWATQTAPDVMSAQVTQVTASSITVRTIPTYSPSTKTFSTPNTSIFFNGGVFAGVETGGNAYRAYTSTGTFRAISATITVTGATITDFLVPDLRGRFAVGQNVDAISDVDFDAANTSSVSAIYPHASLGGEEQHILTTTEMPAHDHNLKVLINAFPVTSPTGNLIGADNTNSNFNGTVSTTITGSDGRPPHTATTGSNTAHNNMPPYLAVRYIIKARSYTRAAIIDDVEIPYDKLLVTDLRSGLIRQGGMGEDLVFKVNNDISTTGIERMRLSNSGRLGVGTQEPRSTVHISTAASTEFQLESRSTLLPNSSGVNRAFLRFTSNDSLSNSPTEGSGIGSIGFVGDGSGLFINSRSSNNGEGDIRLSSGNSTRLTLKADGDINVASSATLQFLNVGTNPDSSNVINFGNETTSTGVPVSDGACIKYVASGLGGEASSVDGLIFEKTDVNQTTPDGGIAFTRRAMDGIRHYDFTIAQGRILIGATLGERMGAKLDIRSPNNETCLWVRGQSEWTGFLARLDTNQIGKDSGNGLLIQTGNLTQTNSAPLSIDAATSATNSTLVSIFDVYGDGTVYARGNVLTGTPITATTPSNRLVTKAWTDSREYTFTYGKSMVLSRYSNVWLRQYGDGSGPPNAPQQMWDNTATGGHRAANYFDVFPPSGFVISNLVAFISSIADVYYSGGVDGNDSIHCNYRVLSDRVRVWVFNTENRLPSSGNWFAVWRK